MTSSQLGSPLSVLVLGQHLYPKLNDNLSVHSFNPFDCPADPSLLAPTPGRLLALDLMADLKPDVRQAKARSSISMQKPKTRTMTTCSLLSQAAQVSSHGATYQLLCLYNDSGATTSAYNATFEQIVGQYSL